MPKNAGAHKAGTRKVFKGVEYVVRIRKDKNGRKSKRWIKVEGATGRGGKKKKARVRVGSAKNHQPGDEKVINGRRYVVRILDNGQKRWVSYEGRGHPHWGASVGFGAMPEVAPYGGVLEEEVSPEMNAHYGLRPGFEATGAALQRDMVYCAKQVKYLLSMVFQDTEFITFDINRIAIQFLQMVQSSGVPAAVENLKFIVPNMDAVVQAQAAQLTTDMREALRPCSADMAAAAGVVPQAPAVGVMVPQAPAVGIPPPPPLPPV